MKEMRIALVRSKALVNAVWAALADQTAFTDYQVLDLRPDRFKQSCDAEDAHHPFEVVREHMKAHLGTYPW